MNESTLHIHFDYIVTNDNQLCLGVVILDGDDGELLSSNMTKFNIAKKQGNNFHYTLSAFGYAFEHSLSYLQSEDLLDMFTTLTFCNQNKYIFNWFTTAKYAAKYTKAMTNVYKSYKKLLENLEDTEITFSEIKGTKNQAKLSLKNQPTLEQMPHNKMFTGSKKAITDYLNDTDKTSLFFSEIPFDIEPSHEESVEDLIKELNEL